MDISNGMDKLQKRLNTIYLTIEELKYTLPEEIIKNKTKVPIQK